MISQSLFQHGTLGALMAGLFEGTLSIEELLTHGNLGIGTLHDLDGELIILNGQAFQAKSNGTVIHLTGTETVPYAAVTSFESQSEIPFSEEITASELKKVLQEKMTSLNTFQAIKLTGSFSHMHVRAVPKQTKPYPRLVEAARVQPEYKQQNIKGTVVGFYTPQLFQGAAAAGFHLHFLSDDQQFGGHILDFTLAKGTVEFQTIETLIQHFPIENAAFMENEIDYANLHAEIEEAEN